MADTDDQEALHSVHCDTMSFILFFDLEWASFYVKYVQTVPEMV